MDSPELSRTNKEQIYVAIVKWFETQPCEIFAVIDQSFKGEALISGAFNLNRLADHVNKIVFPEAIT